MAYENTPLLTPSLVAVEVTELSRVFAVQQNRGWNRAFKPKTQVTALQPLSCSIPTGQRCAVSGRNGSGKSTFLKILAGVIHPTSGTAQSLGFVPWKRKPEYLRRVGAMFGQKSMLFGDLTLTDALELYRPLYRLDQKTLAQSLAELDDYFHQGRIQDIPVRKMSLGQRITCETVVALFHQPELLILDEPTIGMDRETRNQLAAYLTNKTLSLDGAPRTLLLTTHDHDFAEVTCDFRLHLERGAAPIHTRMSKDPISKAPLSQMSISQTSSNQASVATTQRYVAIRYLGERPTLLELPNFHSVEYVPARKTGTSGEPSRGDMKELYCLGVDELDKSECEALLDVPGVQEVAWRIAPGVDRANEVDAS